MIQEIKFYFIRFLSRLPILVLLVLLGAIVGLFVAASLPASYRAESRLVVESPQIPGNLASSTVQAGAFEILGVIQQRLLTRSNLLEMSERFGIPNNAADLSTDEIVTNMKNSVLIDIPIGTSQGASVVNVSFISPSPKISANVTNELVERILKQNVEMRTSFAGQTLEFFAGEVERLDRELSAQSGKILEFKRENKNALPGSFDYNRTRQSSLEERLLQIDRELSSQKERRARLVEIFDRTGRIEVLGENLSPEQRQLQQLKDELASSLVIYSESNPRVRSLKARIAALESANIKLGLNTNNSPSVTAFELQLSEIDGEIELIFDQKALVTQELQRIAEALEAIPRNAVTLSTLERTNDNLRSQYAEATENLAEARTGEQIEAQLRGQRITVTEWATVPTFPDRPNRKLIVTMGVAGGFMIGLSIIVLLELMNRSIKMLSHVTPYLDAPIVMEIEAYGTPRSRMKKWGIGVTMIGVVGVIGYWFTSEFIKAGGSLEAFLETVSEMPIAASISGLIEERS